MSSQSWLRCLLTTLSQVENTTFEATVDMEIAKTSLAICCKIEYFIPLTFHHDKISKSSFS